MGGISVSLWVVSRFLTSCARFLQRWPRQSLEDGDLTTKAWAADRAGSDTENYDSIANTPKPPKDAAPKRTKRKAKAPASATSAAETGDDDCQIMEVLDRLPISSAPPTSSGAESTESQAAGSSRGVKRSSGAAPSEEAPKTTKRKLRLAADSAPRPAPPKAARQIKVRAGVTG